MAYSKDHNFANAKHILIHDVVDATFAHGKSLPPGWADIGHLAGEVARAVGKSGRSYASDRRKASQLLAVRRGGHHFFPAFQLDASGPVPSSRAWHRRPSGPQRRFHTAGPGGDRAPLPVITLRDLELLQLHGHGFRHVKAAPAELTHSSPPATTHRRCGGVRRPSTPAWTGSSG